MFHDAVDTSGKTKNAELIAEIISACIDEIGEENVVLVVTDNAANCKSAGVSSIDCSSELKAFSELKQMRCVCGCVFRCFCYSTSKNKVSNTSR